MTLVMKVGEYTKREMQIGHASLGSVYDAKSGDNQPKEINVSRLQYHKQ